MDSRPIRKTTPILVKCLMLLLVVALGSIGVRLVPATAREGWIPGMGLIAGLAGVVGALIEILRAP
jgi:hypothetical protein